MKPEFYVIRVRVASSPTWLYYAGGALGYPGSNVPFERAEHFSEQALAEAVLSQMMKAGDVGYVHPVVKYGEEFSLEESVCHNLPSPTEEFLRAHGPAAFVIALADSFPCLRGKVEGLGFTRYTWDVDQWVRNSRKWSHAERCAAEFVAMIWNYHGARSKKWKFDVVDAVGVWDNGNRAAFIAWAKKPIWP